MKKKIGRILISSAMSAVMCVLPCVSQAALIDGYEIDDDAKTITVHGTVDGLKKNDSILIQIMNKGKSPSEGDYTREKLLADFLLVKQLPADPNGGYSVTVNMKNCEAGVYPVRINGQTPEKELYYSTVAEKNEIAAEVLKALAELPEAEAISKLAEILQPDSPKSDPMKILNITDETVFTAEASKLCGVLYENLKGTTALTPEELRQLIMLSAHIEAVNKNTKSVYEYAKEFKLDEARVKLYEEKLSDAAKSNFTAEYFKDKNYKTAEKIAEVFTEAVPTAMYKNFTSWGDAEFFIENLGKELGIDLAAYNSAEMTTADKNTLYTYLIGSGKSAANLKAFVSLTNAKISELSAVTVAPPKGGGGGGGGGSRLPSDRTGSSGVKAVDPIKPVIAEESGVTFDDLGGFEWAKDSIYNLAKLEIVSGTSDNTFEPGRNVTREEMLTMLIRAYGIKADEGVVSEFSDSEENAWYEPYLAAAKAAGFVNGKPDGSFGVGEDILRQDAAVMAYRIAAARGAVFSTEKSGIFSDDALVSDYASEAVYALKNAGILSGTGNGMFAPNASCTRAEAAKIVDMLIK